MKTWQRLDSAAGLPPTIQKVLFIFTTFTGKCKSVKYLGPGCLLELNPAFTGGLRDKRAAKRKLLRGSCIAEEDWP